MGVKGLWAILSAGAQQRNLKHMALSEGFEHSRGVRAYRIGIDISIWFEELQQVKVFRPTAASGQNAVLQLLFWRLVHLHCLPVLPFFVFKGNERPDFKRGKHVLKVAHWMQNGAEYLIDAFGFGHSTAPGEAEAELAAMNQAGRIDAVVTNDVDTFLFGGLTIIRTWNKKDNDSVTTYNRADIEHDISASMNRDGMILFSLLSGADYNKGLQGCGPNTALGAIKYGLGGTLCDAARTMGLDEFRTFLVGWREDLRKVLSEDPENYIGRRNPAIGDNITNTFPDPDVVQSYLMPLTSLSRAQQLPSINDRQLPDVARISELCERYFEWATPSGILPKFLKHIWPGVVLRMVRDDILNADNMQESGGHSPELVTTAPNVIRRRTVDGMPECKVRFPTSNFAAGTMSGLHELSQTAKDQAEDVKGKKCQRDSSPDIATYIDVWLPSTIFRTWTARGMSKALMVGVDNVLPKAPKAHRRAPPVIMTPIDTTPTSPPIHHITPSSHHHVNVDLTTPTPPPVCCAVPCRTSTAAPDHSLPVTNGMIIDLTHEDKIIYDLTDIE